ncbi:MAG: hypothetical protein A4E73_00267 [Syntrophaceae bacterium PtaU1.Bin231]|nr:MAG: hypothetical protein A4E73_00267 [Syntrophaceae bacterium PtaU1.Bin231]
MHGVDVGPVVEIADEQKICRLPVGFRHFDFFVHVRDDVDGYVEDKVLDDRTVIGCNDPYPVGLPVDGDLPFLGIQCFGLEFRVPLQFRLAQLAQKMDVHAVDDDPGSGGIPSDQRHVVLGEMPEADHSRLAGLFTQDSLQIDVRGNHVRARMVNRHGVAGVGFDSEFPEDRHVTLRVFGASRNEDHVRTECYERLEDMEKPQGSRRTVEHGKKGVKYEDVLLLRELRNASPFVPDAAAVGRDGIGFNDRPRCRPRLRHVAPHFLCDAPDLEPGEGPPVEVGQLVEQSPGRGRAPAGSDHRLDFPDASDLVREPLCDKLPFLHGLGNHAVVPDARIWMGLVEPVLGSPLLFAAPAELVVRDRADHVADGPAVEEHLEPEFREAPTQLDVLRAEAELLPEHTVFDEKRSLAGRPAAPEVGKVEFLAVPEGLVSEQELAHVHDVVHDRCDLKRGIPGRVAQHGDVLLGVLPVRSQVLFQQVAVGHVVIVEEEENGGLRREDAEVFRRGDPRVGLGYVSQR